MIHIERLWGQLPVQTQQLLLHQKFNFSRTQGRLAFRDRSHHLRQGHRNLSSAPSQQSLHRLPFPLPSPGIIHQHPTLMVIRAIYHHLLLPRSRRPLQQCPRQRQTSRPCFLNTPTYTNRYITICQARTSQRMRHPSQHPPLNHPLHLPVLKPSMSPQ